MWITRSLLRLVVIIAAIVSILGALNAYGSGDTLLALVLFAVTLILVAVANSINR
jgi:hypothetical protein